MGAWEGHSGVVVPTQSCLRFAATGEQTAQRWAQPPEWGIRSRPWRWRGGTAGTRTQIGTHPRTHRVAHTDSHRHAHRQTQTCMQTCRTGKRTQISIDINTTHVSARTGHTETFKNRNIQRRYTGWPTGTHTHIHTTKHKRTSPITRA